MPGVPLVVCETTCRSFGWNCNSRIADQMCRQQSHSHLSAEEALEAEESLSVYCKPVELYNILHRRAIKNPSLLRRCLHYMIEAKRKKRIQITVSLSRTLNTEVEPEGLFPLYVLLARPVDIKDSEHSFVYRLSRASVLITFSELGKKTETEANFIIPEIKKLTSDVRVGNLTIILVRHGKTEGAGENYLPKDLDEVSSFLSKLEGNCFWGKLHLESLHSSMEKHVTLSLGHTTEMLSTFNMHPCSLEPSCLDQNCLTFRPHNSDLMGSYQVQVNLSAREIGESERSPYDSYTYHDVPRTSLPHIIRLRTGNVLFNYRYYNNKLQKTEVTEDFSCPFCLMKCASFKGLRYHLISSHDLFNFEFWVTEEFQAVNVSVRTDIWRSEVVPDGADPRLQTFFYRSKFRRRRRSKNLVQNVNHAHPHVLSSNSPDLDREGSCEDCLKDNVANFSHRRITYPSDAGLSNGLNGSCSDREDRSSKILLDETHSLSGRHKLESSSSEIHLTMESKEPVTSSPDDADVCLTDDYTPTTMLQFAKTRKLSIERADPRNRLLLQKRQFFHSHRAQPMALEQVFSDRDSEDEVDDDIADFEDRKMLDDFVDVTTIEKQMMHLWNSFVRKQRVLADGHIPWSCEAFSQLHGKDLVQAPALLRCWRLFMVKLWNHSLLDARSMNNCNLILERCQDESSH